MPNRPQLLEELQQAGSPFDVIRRKYLAKLNDLTGRDTIVYYSGWLQKPQLYQQFPEPFAVFDGDKDGFMATIHGLERKSGLDLFLHTPGGDLAALESLVSYLRSMFGTDIRAIVPQLALSAGTMLACACREILMGLHSSLGPIDPQMGGIPAHGIIEEFDKAAKEIGEDPAKIAVWQPIIAKYSPTLIGECQKAIKWSEDIVRDWLVSGMFKGKANPSPRARAEKVIEELGAHNVTLSHARHYDVQQIEDLGLNVVRLETDDALQDAILTVHHLCIQTMAGTNTVKLIENHNGVAFASAMQLQPVPVANG